MSKENFVEYYETWLRKPENKALADEVDAITNEEEFAKAVLEQGKANGFSFSEKDVGDVMGAAQARVIDEAAKSSDAELSDEDLEKVAGGLSAYSFAPSIQIRSVASVGNINNNLAKRLNPGSLDPGQFAASTVMCCW